MSDGHRTSTISRPRVDRTANPGLFDDFTTPIPLDRQLVPQRRGRLVLGLFATLIAFAIGASLFVLPIKSWLKQNDDIRTRTSELATLNAANQQLHSEVERLQSDAGIKEAAREEIDYVEAGEQRISVLPIGPASTVLPAGWPYELISTIVSLRQAESVAAAAAALTTTTG